MNNLSMQCFEGVHRDFVIECVPGSYAEAFALEHGFQYDNGEKQVIGWTITDPQEKIKWVVANYIREDMTEREKALVLQRDNTVILCVAADVEKARSVLDKYF